MKTKSYMVKGICIFTVVCFLALGAASMTFAQAADPAAKKEAAAPAKKEAAPAKEATTPAKHGKAHAKKVAKAAKPAPDEKVKAAQEALEKDGFKIKATGVMNKKTVAAIKKYQKKNGLKVTGKLDDETAAKLGVK